MVAPSIAKLNKNFRRLCVTIKEKVPFVTIIFFNEFWFKMKFMKEQCCKIEKKTRLNKKILDIILYFQNNHKSPYKECKG